MVVIRLARAGAKKRPFYHLVATDKRNSRDGRFIERLGYFNPVARKQEARLTMDKARIDYWVSNGAQLSDRVSDLVKEFVKNGCETVEARPPVVPKPKQKAPEVTEEAPAEDTTTATESSDTAAEKTEAAPATDAKPAEEAATNDSSEDNAKAEKTEDTPAEEQAADKAEKTAETDMPAEEKDADKADEAADQPKEEAKADDNADKA